MAGLSFLAYLIAFLIIGIIACAIWNAFASVMEDAWNAPSGGDSSKRRIRCYNCGAKGQWNNSHCPPCEAKRLADQPAKDRATFKLAYDLARRERQKARRALAKAAKTATPQTGPIVVPKGQPYRP